MVAGVWDNSFLPSFLQGHRKRVSEGAKESRVQVNCGCPSISTSQYLREHTQRQGRGAVGWKLAERCLDCQHAVRARVSPLEQGAGAFWGWRGCVRGAVTHGKYVIVAGDVGAAGNVIGVLGEAGGHSIGSLQDTHRWLCDSLGQKEGKRSERYVRIAKERWTQAKEQRRKDRCMQQRGSLHLLSSRLTLSVLAHTGGHDQRGHKPQDPAELHTPEQQHTHQHHRHSCSHCPGGWPCLQRALHGGRGTSSPRSCSLCAYKPALEGL